MIRRVLLACLTVLALGAGRAEAVTIRDIIELSKAGLGDSVLLALIEVDRTVYAIDTATIRKLKDAGISDIVIVAMIRSGRETPVPPPAPAPVETTDPPPAPEPQVIVIDHHDSQPAPVAYPVAVPVYVPVATAGIFDGVVGRNSNVLRNSNVVKATIQTDQGLVRARVPLPLNCVNAQPVFWGFGGKLRPGSWEPPPTVLCR
jgi:hypothetical protein